MPASPEPFLWCRRHRQVLRAQLGRSNGQGIDPFDGAGDVVLFAETDEAKRVLAGWIAELDRILRLEDADRA